MSMPYKIPFIVLQDKREEYDQNCRMENRESDQSPIWRDIDGKEITSDTLGSDAFISADGADAYFFLPDEKEGWTIYHVNMRTFRSFVASQPHQIIVPGDAELVCLQLAKRKTTAELVREAGRKGKGASAAGVILFTRNKSRSDSLVDYRKKMRQRQFPLKKEKQWEFIVKLGEEEQITSDALQQAVFLLRDMEAARDGRTEVDVPEGWTQQKGKSLYVLAAVEG